MRLRIFDNTPEEIAASDRNPLNGMIHSDDRIYGMICLCGSGVFHAESGEMFEVNKQDCVLVYQRDFIFEDKSPDFTLRILQVDKNFLTHLLDPEFRQGLFKLFSRPRQIHLGRNQFDIYEKSTRFLRLLMKEHSMIEYKREIINGFLRVFTYTSLMNLERTGTNADPIGYNSKRENKVSDKFLDLVRNNFKENRTIIYYADRLGMSKRNLCSLVLKSTGRNATDWIEDYLVGEIKRLLAHTDMTVKSIAYELNFSSPSHLIKYFKKATGVTPREYRLNYQTSRAARKQK